MLAATPKARMVAAVASATSCLARYTMATAVPALANSTATPLPMPPLPPKITAAPAGKSWFIAAGLYRCPSPTEI